MSSILERRYRLLLSSYPHEYLDTHEEEMLATLLEGAKPGQVRPRFREAAELVISGLRTRVRLAAAGGSGTGWGGALRLAALLLLASVLSDRLGAGSDWVALRAAAFVALAIVAVVMGAERLGILMALLALGASVASTPSSELLIGPVWLAPDAWLFDNVGLLATAVVLGAASIRRGHRRPWPWWIAGATIVIALWLQLFGLDILFRLDVPWSLVELVLPVALLSGAALLLHDPRTALAAMVYAAVHLVKPIYVIGPGVIFGFATGFEILVLSSVALASAVVSSRWQAEDLTLPNTPERLR